MEPEKPCEVLCGGVIGHTIRQGRERYQALIRTYRPKIVVAAYGAINEHYPAGALTDEGKILRNLDQKDGRWSFRILDFLYYLGNTVGGEKRETREGQVPLEEEWQERRREAGRMDWPGLRRVSLAEFEENLLALKKEVQADGAILILVSMPRMLEAERGRPILVEYSKVITRVAQREGLDCLDARALFREWIEDHKATEKDLLLDAVHPTPKGHLLIAEALKTLILRRL
jgi:hypothetical protein